MRYFIAVFSLIFLCIPHRAASETLILKNGQDISGTIVSEDETIVTIETVDGTQTIPRSNIYEISDDSTTTSAHAILQAYNVIMRNGQVYEGTIVMQNDSVIKLDTGFGIIELDRQRVLSLEEKQSIRTPFINKRVTILRSNGEIITGTIIEENNTHIRLKGDAEEEFYIDQDDIMSIKANEQNEPSPVDKLLEAEYHPDSYYRTQAQILEERVNIYQNDLQMIEEDMSKMRERYEEKIATLNEKIDFLEQKLQKKEKQLSTEKFPELTLIKPGEAIIVNNSYIKSVTFRITQEFEGYFVSAEYVLFNEFVDVLPDFEIYFYNENGLNIGMDKVHRQFTHVVRGKEETIVSGIPMTISESAPKYFYIKLIK